MVSMCASLLRTSHPWNDSAQNADDVCQFSPIRAKICSHSNFFCKLSDREKKVGLIMLMPPICLPILNKNSSGDEIVNVYFLRRYRTYFKILKKENLLRLTN